MVSGSNGTASKHLKWAVLISSLLAFVAYAFGLQVVPPLMTSIMTEFGISNAEAGLLMSFVLLPGIILSIPVSIAMERYGARVTGGIALVCVVISSFMTATANSFTALLLARLILGIGGSLILIVTPAIVPQWFSKEELGRAMGIFSVSMPLATIIAFPTAGTLAVTYGWRSSFYLSLVIGVIATVVYVLIVRDGPMSSRGGGFTGLSAFKNLEVWKVGIIWLFFNGAILSFNTWAPTLLIDFKGFTPVEASFYASLMSWISFFAIPLYGTLSDRLGKRKVFIVAGAAILCLTEIAAAYSSGVILIMVIVAIGLVSAMLPGNIQTLPSEILGPSKAGIGFAVLGICGNIGMAATQPIAGMILDASGSYSLSILSMAVFAALCCGSALLVKAK
jgi:NNP family nitrate/nitrite transporter-like MFS transporter